MTDEKVESDPVPDPVLEDWNDTDSVRELQDALAAEIKRKTEEQTEKYEIHPPQIAFEIPKGLYEKAQKENDQLTDDERALLLSRGDVVGKALANPKSLTEAELYQVLRLPPPEIIQPVVREATGGALSSPFELLAKAREAKENGQLHTLSFEELKLLAEGCQVDLCYIGQTMNWEKVPGNKEAMHLIGAQAGWDVNAVMEMSMYWMKTYGMARFESNRRDLGRLVADMQPSTFRQVDTVPQFLPNVQDPGTGPESQPNRLGSVGGTGQ